jgi:hypothetical protein
MQTYNYLSKKISICIRGYLFFNSEKNFLLWWYTHLHNEHFLNYYSHHYLIYYILIKIRIGVMGVNRYIYKVWGYLFG